MLGGIRMNKKKLVIPILLGLIATFYIGSISTTLPSQLNIGGGREGSAWIVCVNNKDCETFHNVITNQYLNETITHAFFTSGDSAANFSWMALGNGTVPAAASTSLNAEIADCGLARALGTASWVGTGNASITKTWTSTCNGVVVNTTMLLNASSTGLTYGGGEFTDRTLQTSDNITVTAYTWWTSS
jgi:hypothetical protein